MVREEVGLGVQAVLVEVAACPRVHGLMLSRCSKVDIILPSCA